MKMHRWNQAASVLGFRVWGLGFFSAVNLKANKRREYER